MFHKMYSASHGLMYFSPKASLIMLCELWGVHHGDGWIMGHLAWLSARKWDVESLQHQSFAPTDSNHFRHTFPNLSYQIRSWKLADSFLFIFNGKNVIFDVEITRVSMSQVSYGAAVVSTHISKVLYKTKVGSQNFGHQQWWTFVHGLPKSVANISSQFQQLVYIVLASSSLVKWVLIKIAHTSNIEKTWVVYNWLIRIGLHPIVVEFNTPCPMELYIQWCGALQQTHWQWYLKWLISPCFGRW